MQISISLFRIATSLGAFQELGAVYFEIMKDSMFDDRGAFDRRDSDEEDDADLVSRVINAPAATLRRAAGAAAAVAAVAAAAWVAWTAGLGERMEEGKRL